MKNLFILIVIILGFLSILDASAGPGAIFSGPDIKMLKDNIKFKNTNTRIMTGDSDDPTSVAKEADESSLYLRDGTGEVYLKTDSGLSTNWILVLPTVYSNPHPSFADTEEFGDNALASSTLSVAFGKDTVASGGKSSAVGYSADATGTDSTAIGSSAVASGFNGVALGTSANATGVSTVAIGKSAFAQATNTIAIGRLTQGGVSSSNCTLVGTSTTSTGTDCTQIGYNIDSTGNNVTALGANIVASSFSDTILLGEGLTATANNEINIGDTIFGDLSLKSVYVSGVFSAGLIATGDLPSASSYEGYQAYDSTLDKPVFSNGASWNIIGFQDKDALVNPSFESSDIDNGWTITSASASAETVSYITHDGKQAISLAVTASPFEMYQTFDCSDYDTSPVGFTAYVSASPSAELEFCGFDGTTETNCTSLYTSTSSTEVLAYQKILAESQGGSTCGIKIKSDASITETILVDAVRFTPDPYKYVEIENSYHISSFENASTTGGPNAVEVIFSGLVTNGKQNLLAIDDANKTNFTATEPVIVDVSYTATCSAANCYMVVRKNGTDHYYGTVNGAGGNYTAVSTTLYLDAGESFSLKAIGSSLSLSNSHVLKIDSKSMATRGVVVPLDNNLSNWESAGVLTIDAVSSTPTKGTTDVDEVRCRRVGDSMEVEFTYSQTGAGASGTGDYLFSIPTTCAGESGLTIDSSKVTLYTSSEGSGAYNYKGTRLGEGSWLVSGENFEGVAIAYDSTQFRIFATGFGSQDAANSSDTSLANSTIQFSGRLIVPITTWDSDSKTLGFVPTHKIAYLKEEDTAAVASSSNTVQTRALDAVSGDTDIVSLDSNQFTLGPGKYDLDYFGYAYKSGYTAVFIYNVTDAEYVSTEQPTTHNAASDAMSIPVHGHDTITLKAPKVFELRHYTASGDAAGLGNSGYTATSNPATTNIHSQVKITKIY